MLAFAVRWLLPFLLTTPLLAAPLVVSFSARAISVSGVAPGGRVVLFGVAREAKNAIPTIVRRTLIGADDDRDGTVQFDIAPAVPRLGMWSAVDLTTGAHAAFATPGFEPLRIDVAPDLVRNDSAGQLRKVEWPFAELDLVVARPGEGAWYLYASAASALDENRGTGRPLRLDISNMQPIGDSPAAPRNLKPGDVLAIFDRGQLQYGIVEVGR